MSPIERGQGRIKSIIATVAVTTVVVGGAALGTIIDRGGGGPPSSDTANLWVDTNGGVCTRFGTPGSYSDAGACASFDAAYQAANSGDTIKVIAGTYPFQTILTAASPKTAEVVIEPSDPESVVDVAGVAIRGADWVTLSNLVNTQNQRAFSMASDGASGHPDNNTFLNLDGPWFDLQDGSAVNNTISGGDYGPCSANANGDGQGCTARLIGQNEVVDGITVHDITSTDATNFHPDGIFVRGCVNCVIKNSTFYNNQITNIRVQNCCSLPSISNLAIYNNWFAKPFTNQALTSVRHDGVDVDGPISSLVIAFNSFSSTSQDGTTYGAYIADSNSGGFGTAATPAQFYGNLFIHTTNCGSGSNYTYSYNVWRKYSSGGVSCGATEVQTTSLFPYVSDPTGSGSIDYTIIGPTWAGDELVPASLCDDFPTDRNGASRNDGNGCDAGAVER